MPDMPSSRTIHSGWRLVLKQRYWACQISPSVLVADKRTQLSTPPVNSIVSGSVVCISVVTELTYAKAIFLMPQVCMHQFNCFLVLHSTSCSTSRLVIQICLQLPLALLLCLCFRSFIMYVTTCKIDNVASALFIHKWRVDACIHGSTLQFLWAQAYSTDLHLTSCVYLHVSNLLAQLWLSSVKDMSWRALISLDVKDAAQKIKEKTREEEW